MADSRSLKNNKVLMLSMEIDSLLGSTLKLKLVIYFNEQNFVVVCSYITSYVTRQFSHGYIYRDSL